MKKQENPDYHIYRNRQYRPDMSAISKKFQVGDYVMFRGNREMEPFLGFVKVKYGNTAMVSMVEKGLVGLGKANEFNNVYVCPYRRLKLVKHD